MRSARRSPASLLRATTLVTALAHAACGGPTAPTPVPAGPTASASAAPSVTPSASPSGPVSTATTGRVSAPDGSASIVLPAGWQVLRPDDPLFLEWFSDELREQVESGLISLVAADVEGSTPGVASYLFLAPLDLAQAGYLAAVARSVVDGGIAGGATITEVSLVDLPAGSTRRVTVGGESVSAEGAVTFRRVVHAVGSGDAPQIILYQALDVAPAEADAEAAAVAESLEVAASGPTLDVPEHTCESVVPLAAASGETAQLDELGQDHVEPGTAARYAHCPPTSGTHYAFTLAPRFHGPTEATVPQEWVHNLEHGEVVLLYRCADGCTADARVLALIAQDAPPTPICERQGLSVARYDDLPAPFALLAWGHIRYYQAIEVADVRDFMADHGDRGPERMCGASGSPDASAAP